MELPVNRKLRNKLKKVEQTPMIRYHRLPYITRVILYKQGAYTKLCCGWKYRDSCYLSCLIKRRYRRCQFLIWY